MHKNLISGEGVKPACSKAFTLAETLIVIGIIGVVAALTLPNLNHATGDKETVTKVKKIYSALTEAVDRAQAIYGPFDEWFTDIERENNFNKFSKRAGERISEFMKVSKNCELESNKGCFTDARIGWLSHGVHEAGVDLDDSNYLGVPMYRFITADGTSVGIIGNIGQLDIYVDIDGPKRGTNSLGKDLFMFVVIEDDNSLHTYGQWDSFNDLLSGHSTSDCCYEGSSEWIIRYDNMDYLKIDANGKCPNGNTLTEANPRCN